MGEPQYVQYQDISLYGGQSNLANALIATLMVGDHDIFSAKDIYLAIAEKTSGYSVPTRIYDDHPHHVLEFDSFEQMNTVERLCTIEANRFAVVLSRWTKYYKNHTNPWIKQVGIEISGIPMMLCRSEYVSPLVSPYCDIQTLDFSVQEGTCVMIAYASSYIGIPTNGIIGLRCMYGGTPKVTAVEVSIFARPRVTQDDILRVMEAYYVDGYHPGMLHTAAQFGVDLEVLRDHYKFMDDEEAKYYATPKTDPSQDPDVNDYDYYEGSDVSSEFGMDSD